jgi:hypoxanthine-guanine phosphoribosyltransferase
LGEATLHTYLLSDDDVDRYASDFVQRLVAMGEGLPRRWFTLGISGDKILDGALLPLLPEDIKEKTDVIRVGFDRTKKRIVSRDRRSPVPRSLEGESVLIIDGAIHSGSSMRHLADELGRRGAASIWSYSLVLKRTSEFIPSFFGLLIGEHDRVFFQLDELPNNRLFTQKATQPGKSVPIGILRLLREDDVDRKPDRLQVGVPSID